MTAPCQTAFCSPVTRTSYKAVRCKKFWVLLRHNNNYHRFSTTRRQQNIYMRTLSAAAKC